MMHHNNIHYTRHKRKLGDHYHQKVHKQENNHNTKFRVITHTLLDHIKHSDITKELTMMNDHYPTLLIVTDVSVMNIRLLIS